MAATTSGPILATTFPGPASNRNVVGAPVVYSQFPYTGVPTTGQIWPRSRTTIVEEGMTRITTTISTNTTLAAADKIDYTYLCSALLTATLPTAVGNNNKYSIKRTGAGVVTIATTGGQLIDGNATYTLDYQNQAVDLISNNANWVIV